MPLSSGLNIQRQAVTAKTASTIFLATGEGTQLAILLVKVLPATFDFADVGAKQDARNQQPGNRQEQERKRSAYQQPVEKTYFLAECLLDVAHGDAVGWRTDDSRNAADRCRVGDAEQQASGEVAFRHAVLRYPPGFLQAGANTAVQYQVDNAQGDRNHHGRAGGIRDPHAQERSDGHEAADDGARTRPDQAQDAKGDAPVETPALDGQPDDEATHEEENDVRGVGRQDFVEGRNAQ